MGETESVLIVMTGVPGSGKSSVARGIARSFGAGIVSVDPIEAAMFRSGLVPSFETGVAAYEVAATIAEEHIRLGLTVVVDAVNAAEAARQRWRRLASETSVEMRVIEVVCTDVGLHRSRLATRRRAIIGFPEPGWAEVERVIAEYEPWPETALVLDSVAPLDHNIALAVAHVSGQGTPDA